VPQSRSWRFWRRENCLDLARIFLVFCSYPQVAASCLFLSLPSGLAHVLAMGPSGKAAATYSLTSGSFEGST
jgi:hypothetical protein